MGSEGFEGTATRKELTGGKVMCVTSSEHTHIHDDHVPLPAKRKEKRTKLLTVKHLFDTLH